jgi:hypothetical protein
MKGDKKMMPDILVAGGSSALDGLASTAMRVLMSKGDWGLGLAKKEKGS